MVIHSLASTPDPALLRETKVEASLRAPWLISGDRFHSLVAGPNEKSDKAR